MVMRQTVVFEIYWTKSKIPHVCVEVLRLKFLRLKFLGLKFLGLKFLGLKF